MPYIERDKPKIVHTKMKTLANGKWIHFHQQVINYT